MKCSFCGGDVVDGRCQDCGMPYAAERRYTLRSEGEDARPAPQEAENPRRRAAPAPGRTPAYDRPPVKRAPQRPKGSYAARREQQMREEKVKRGTASVIVWMVLAVLALQIIPMLFTSCSA